MNKSRIKKNERENDHLHATFKIGLSELVVVLPLVFFMLSYAAWHIAMMPLRAMYAYITLRSAGIGRRL